MSLSGNILSAIGAAGQLFAGYGSVTLGPVQFQGLGKPQSMPIGGRQAIAVHKLPGGARVLDAMGPDNADIAWSGYLDGADAAITARALDKIRQSGQPVMLAWDVFSYQVLVSEFICEIRHVPMPYRVCCTVIVDNSQVVAPPLIDLAIQIAADISSGNPSASLSTASQAILGSTMSVAGAAAAAAGATTLGSSAYTVTLNAVNAATNAIDLATTSVADALVPVGASLGALSAAAPLAVDPVGMSDQITLAVSNCGDLAQLASAQGFIGRAGANLQRASA